MKNQLRRSGIAAALAAALVAVVAACGHGEDVESAVTGMALFDGPITGRVSLNDSSSQEQRRTVTSGEDGSFTFEVAGLTPPYEVEVEWDAGGSPSKLFAIAEGNASVDVNPITDAVFAAASARDGDDHRSVSEERMETARRARNILVQLQTVLAPLFERYGITNPATDRTAVRELLEDVRVRRDDGVVTMTSRATQELIFRGSIRDLSAGTFYPENMPAGPGAPPPAGTCTAFTYSAWGACQSNSTQTRSVLTASPSGCTGGSPVVSQACTYTPPVTTCSAFTYSAWGACESNSTQTRSVLTSSPSGCTGGSPVVSQACTYTPPTQSCTTCHGIPPATGKHTRHTSEASCATCHGTGYSTTTANAATHMNGVKNLTSTIGWSATNRTCANSCHGSKSW
jgi:hypothetical protein